MAEGGFDPCECVCSHEHAMRRLINLYRGPTIIVHVDFQLEGGLASLPPHSKVSCMLLLCY
ncbi:hypothetical protein FD754_021433 [Muntiacus muntjak]|uniref:Small integral membrane protein 14 n=1 Tax=Muntiacus muntjak TaxID=9888 RepID=A0A5N3V5Q8_MUNMU|nr:hypothetical protein FD754_021433 [Muntiacus muntjak]